MAQNKMQAMLFKKATSIIGKTTTSRVDKENNTDLTATLQVYIDEGMHMDFLSKDTTLLCEVSRAGLDGRATMLLEAGADPNQLDGFGCSPLYLAVTYGYPRVVEVLLNNGADIEKGVKGNTPLLACVQNICANLEMGPFQAGFLECFFILIERGASVNFNMNDKSARYHWPSRLIKTIKQDKKLYPIYTAMHQIDFVHHPLRLTAGDETKTRVFRTLVNISGQLLDAGVLLSDEPPPVFYHLSHLLTAETLPLGVSLIEKFLDAGYPSDSYAFNFRIDTPQQDLDLEFVQHILNNRTCLLQSKCIIDVYVRELSQIIIIKTRKCVSLSVYGGTLSKKLDALGLPRSVRNRFDLKVVDL